MTAYQKHIISSTCNAREALKRLEFLPDKDSKTLFVLNEEAIMMGSITDGDIRRGLLNGKEISQDIVEFMNANYHFVNEQDDILNKISEMKRLGISFMPVLDTYKKIIKILDLKSIKTVIPASAVIMAGGRGERLKPFTDTIPKPMLVVGDKPIIEHNIDRIIKYGITEIFICVRYLPEKIVEYFGDGSSKGISINYIYEDNALGTIGAMGMIENINNENVLLMNSDVLTNIDYEDFFKYYQSQESSMCIASIPYQVQIPYAVLDVNDNQILSFIEKPSYTYYSSGGIYFLNKKLQNLIPRDQFYNATDLMQNLISKGKKVTHYPMLNYWLDIGKYQDFLKAQEDIKHIKL